MIKTIGFRPYGRNPNYDQLLNHQDGNCHYSYCMYCVNLRIVRGASLPLVLYRKHVVTFKQGTPLPRYGTAQLWTGL
jgi:hypothetical protein